MSIEVTLKLLNGEKFQVQANPEEKISDLKAKVSEARPELPVECRVSPEGRQKLIYAGKILVDDVTLQDSGYQSSGFIVAMATKAKAPSAKAAPTPAPAATPAPATATPAATPAPTAPAAPAAPAADAPLDEASVQSLMEMGFPRDQVEAALRAAPGRNTMVAVEFLMTGIPEAGPEMPAGGLPFPYGPGGPGGPGGPAGDGDEPMPEVLAQLRNNPQFGQLAAMIAQNPGMMDQVMRGVQQTHPEIAQAIQEHPDAFMRLLQEATGGALQPQADDGFVGPGGATREQLAALTAMLQQNPEMLNQLLPDIEATDPQMAELIRQNPQRLIEQLAQLGGRGGPPGPGMPGMGMPGGMPGGEVIRLTEEENAAVERLAALGFPKEMAAQAYLACDKSEELAANFLFDNAGD